MQVTYNQQPPNPTICGYDYRLTDLIISSIPPFSASLLISSLQVNLS